ncbi:hypothetical protein SISNIDRAFT_486660 [Sistotremastrum niveocremeum HHB9708]|uniref:CBM1 domain-containing protein n=1 Tax=Sistotremastrum niveocremeum HHB9708 TaxID=1314777 RepID=A0A164T6V2_9AGAM|nr:hypothetical protein SISNIDRAFT_486660 [Sistotremastrum niveocremeum HHB9708]
MVAFISLIALVAAISVTTALPSPQTNSTTTTTTSTSSTTSTKPSGVPHYGQCGGTGWPGPFVCQPPYVCTKDCTFSMSMNKLISNLRFPYHHTPG